MRGDFCPELVGLGAQSFIAELFNSGSSALICFDLFTQLFDLTFMGIAPDGFNEFLEHSLPFGGRL